MFYELILFQIINRGRRVYRTGLFVALVKDASEFEVYFRS